MSEFLEEVFAAQTEADEPPPRRQVDEGLSGSARRYVTLLVLLVSLTAVPTWIMLRAGADGLNQPVAAPVQPILPPHPPQTTPAPPQVPVPVQTWAWVEPEPVPPPEQPPPREQTKPRILERRSIVDTPPRPTHKKDHDPGDASTRLEPCVGAEEAVVRCERPGDASAKPEPVVVEPAAQPVPDPREVEWPEIEPPDIEPPDIEPPDWFTRFTQPPCPYVRDSASRAFS